MDISAIIIASDNLLEDLGLSKVGDRLSLRGFCTKEVERVHEKEAEHTREQKRSYLEAFFLRKKVKNHDCKVVALVTSQRNPNPKRSKLDGSILVKRNTSLSLFLWQREEEAE